MVKARRATQKKRPRKMRHGVTNKRASLRRKPAIRLADLFLWIDIVDQCQFNPQGGLKRAATAAGLASAEVTTQTYKRLEKKLQVQLFDRTGIRNPNVNSGVRDGQISIYGAFLAEVCVVIEHLWYFANQGGFSLHDKHKALKLVKNVVFECLTTNIHRELEHEDYRGHRAHLATKRNRLKRRGEWRARLIKLRRRKQHRRNDGKLSSLPYMKARYTESELIDIWMDDTRPLGRQPRQIPHHHSGWPGRLPGASPAAMLDRIFPGGRKTPPA